MEDVKQSIVKVGKEIDQTLEKLDRCQSESDKEYLRKRESQLRDEKLLLLKKEERLHEQLRPAGMFSLKLHIPHINIVHHPLNPLFLIV